MSLYPLMDVFIAFVLEVIIGYPKWIPHPVKFINWLAKVVEVGYRKITDLLYNKKVKALGDDYVHSGVNRSRTEKYSGMCFTIIMALLITIIMLVLVGVAYLINPVVYHVINVYFIYSAFAIKTVAFESVEVCDALKDRDIFKAGNILSKNIGREIEHFDEQDIIRGAVEHTADRAAESVISPVFYAVIGSLFGLGAPMVYLYKTINVLKLTKGHKNGKIENFGYAAVKINDLANFLPARITGILFVIASIFLKKDFKSSFAIMRRDKRKHHNPNLGYPEAAVAGALGIKLGGSGLYFGDIIDKPIIGDNKRSAEIRDISDTITLMYIAAIIGMILFGIVYSLIFAVWYFN
ncbi:MAG TPA: CobD/CbiB family cobalamin biosynthesis protein [Acetivibrio clariflavus]|nr:CobD/CbiB family cobalamin biosynthesis protein [Acetivibrio clariflavus]